MQHIDHTPKPTLLSRSINLSRINWEVVAFTLVIIASIVAHLWNLERMALHHDESIHAWSSWRLYTGAGGFNCWSGLDEEGRPRGGVSSLTYCYDPVYHGPSLYYLTALAYFLFGDGDAQARLPMAVAGVLMTASTWWLRPYLGRSGALLAAILLTFSPSLLYYTRFARHDGLMVLWEIWMLIGALRWLDTGRARWLYLTAAAVALAIATHELYYILFFIFGIFVLMRLLAESRFARYLPMFLVGMMGICLLLMVFNPRIPLGKGLYFGEKAFLVASAFLLAWLCQRLWDHTPRLMPRLQELWATQRDSLWVALAILGGIYVTLYSSFFAYLPGALDGLYAGLAYWLGSQQEFARGDQPWYYYLMLLPLYDPLAVLASLGTVAAMVFAVGQHVLRGFMARRQAAVAQPNAEEEEEAKGKPKKPLVSPALAAPAAMPAPLRVWELYPLLVVFWFWSALIIFSWAGEKMPWLVVHMALPGNLLAAWVLARLVRAARAAATPRIWLVPLLTALTLVAVAVAFWRLGMGGTGQEAQRNLLQGIVPLVLAGGMIYWLLSLGNALGTKAVVAAATLAGACLLGGYTLRATALAVYRHPDTPIELLVYTQTAPEVPRYAATLHELAINLTRGQRTSEDAAGGLRMPLIVDGGNSSGDGSLAWPLQWYLRDFQRATWLRRDVYYDNPTLSAFEVDFPDGSSGLAPVVLLYKPHVSEAVRSVLQEAYVQPYGPTSVFNWWFPEGDKCSPQSAGYKRFYYSTWTRAEEQTAAAAGGEGRVVVGDCGDIREQLNGPFDVMLWPFQRQNWDTLYKFVLYRQLPTPLVPGAREMEFWLRADLAGGGGAAVTTTAASGPELRLLARGVATMPPESSGPTGSAVDAQGNLYVAATGSHQVHIFNSAGEFQRSLGGFGNEVGQLYEPRGVAVDAQGNLYVADTWNARIVKYDASGRVVTTWGRGEQDLLDGRRATITEGDPLRNEANPLGFFGPRGVAVDNAGRVYIADTGNKRIVVTDDKGTFLYQIGATGSAPGQFNEPTGLALDRQGNLYVADTWNGRVQVFAPDETGRLGMIPIVTWNVSGWRANTYDDPSIAANPDGNVYLSVPSRNQVMAFNLRGDLLLRWGGPGDDFASLNSPSGVAVAPDDSVWIVDRNANRALRFVLPEVRSP
ncbi:MAG: TIGR03663 family protein [Candidatus Viridilinea halotolerans]|uniref:TIGR03663 family protein n=1 Tax=Candidatus Viridilinea halotolerans TaxID=2491704 RepID=A0A426TVX7_9CHLR|nr:MAG: TIGR03663 family protein [Candidatus Viridilinea halotolerans]